MNKVKLSFFFSGRPLRASILHTVNLREEIPYIMRSKYLFGGVPSWTRKCLKHWCKLLNIRPLRAKKNAMEKSMLVQKDYKY